MSDTEADAETIAYLHERLDRTEVERDDWQGRALAAEAAQRAATQAFQRERAKVVRVEEITQLWDNRDATYTDAVGFRPKVALYDVVVDLRRVLRAPRAPQTPVHDAEVSQGGSGAQDASDGDSGDCCWTHVEPNTPYLTRMIGCSVCGNKRCPKATDCALACTGSNEPGQPGSRYA